VSLFPEIPTQKPARAFLEIANELAASLNELGAISSPIPRRKVIVAWRRAVHTLKVDPLLAASTH